MKHYIRVRATALIIHREALLVIEFNDEHGLHYNLPGGGVEAGESIIQAVKREVQEEAAVNVEVGNLAFVYEYEPEVNSFKYGDIHSLGVTFECHLAPDATPSMPINPDPYQTAVKWVRLSGIKLHQALA